MKKYFYILTLLIFTSTLLAGYNGNDGCPHKVSHWCKMTESSKDCKPREISSGCCSQD
jgi:hypothetical protein